MIVLYCGECLNLTPTEEEQDRDYIESQHYCRRLKRLLFHEDKHPFIPRPVDCDDYKPKQR